MRIGKALEISIYASDLDAARAFYGDVLGLEFVSESAGRHVFFKLDGQMLLVFNPASTLKAPASQSMQVPPHGATGPGHVCFEADAKEIEEWDKRLQAAGVEVESRIEWPGGGKSIYFRDPAGNSLEFAEARIWGFE